MAATDQLRVATVGSVDDGKSTLLGRLLHDTTSIFEDQLAALSRASRRYGDGDGLHLALLTDGLRAEREQGITIDVAYRYFSTPRRSFVLADTPGHAQYTRNMVTGASVSDVAIVLVDARHGVVEQTRRHLAIASLLHVGHLVVAVNKMDLVEWSQERFDEILLDIAEVLERVGDRPAVQAVPVSALLGDNVVTRSQAAPWYDGPALLSLLEELDATEAVPVGGRVPVQWTIRAGDYRGYAGTLTGGPLAVGDTVVSALTGLRSRVVRIERNGNRVDAAASGDAVAVELADDLDVGRGDTLVVADATVAPVVTSTVDADVCWMIDDALTAGRTYVAKHGSRTVRATVDAVIDRIDLDALDRRPVDRLGVNDLGRIRLTLSSPIVADPYHLHRDTGHLVLVDEHTNATAAAVMLRSLGA
jgi:sulfate adenylyltransferase large subunit